MPQCPTLASPMRATAADIYLSANRRARIQAQFVTARAPPWDSAAIVVIIDPFGSRGLLVPSPNARQVPARGRQHRLAGHGRRKSHRRRTSALYRSNRYTYPSPNDGFRTVKGPSSERVATARLRRKQSFLPRRPVRWIVRPHRCVAFASPVNLPALQPCATRRNKWLRIAREFSAPPTT
jgi:hypothetical protein